VIDFDNVNQQKGIKPFLSLFSAQAPLRLFERLKKSTAQLLTNPIKIQTNLACKLIFQGGLINQ